MRLALFGGTFDPIHRGHLAVAAAAAREFALDQVVFAPTGRQPLKAAAPAAGFADRLAMTALACGAADGPAEPRFVVSSVDAPRGDGAPNFTVDLVEELLRVRPGVELFVLTGADSFLTLRQWREPDRLLALAEWIVVSRPGSPLTGEALARLGLSPAQRARVHLLTTVHEDVSATGLRLRLAAGDPCVDLIPAAVVQYIAERGLYGWPAATAGPGGQRG